MLYISKIVSNKNDNTFRYHLLILELIIQIKNNFLLQISVSLYVILSTKLLSNKK